MRGRCHFHYCGRLQSQVSEICLGLDFLGLQGLKDILKGSPPLDLGALPGFSSALRCG